MTQLDDPTLSPRPITPAIMLGGRSLHRWLVGLPVALYIATLAVFAVFASEHETEWLRTGFALTAASIGAAVVVAIPGALDYQRIPSMHPAKRLGRVHMALHAGAVALLVANLVAHRDTLAWLMRDETLPRTTDLDPTLALALLGAVVALTVVSGAIGLTMAHRHRIGVAVASREQLARAA